ncbi:putative dehydrogenase [Sulfuritortus calidifontis]|uniref:Putative dehydrogenase n=1 Tax=Sulfuritortus calidifontis TaxID=1914471 RepID=A0A4V2UQT4_9PROT|nr:Gfo/Idh/MocA family oxidoreductase [Sulfuritortus calidifontis]TCS72478.1 putative dehydrogenase [Sulfuritortus calidifontis]
MVDRYLIVSLGSIGRRHLKNLRILRPEAEIGVLRLHSSARETDLPEGADIQFFKIDDALRFSPTAAIVASPASTHLTVASSLAKAGIPMLIEKPFSDSCTGLDELIETAKARQLVLMVAYNLRFLPSLGEARRLIKTGAIGRVLGVRAEVGQYLPTWRPTVPYQRTVSAQRAMGGGALLELSHEIDYLYWIFGLPTRVSAVGGHYSDLEIDVEDMVSLCLEYDQSRCLAHIHLDLLQRSTTRSCKFIGTEGTLVWDGIADRLDLFDAASGTWQRIETDLCPDRNTLYVDELRHFLDCVSTGCAPAIGADAAYDVLAIVDAAKASMSGNCSVMVKGYGKY